MLATVLWIGALAVLSLLIIPIGRKNLQPEVFSSFLEAILRRLDPLAWLCLSILIVTGLFQMTGNPNYTGFLEISNRWAMAILIKHLVFLGMVGASAYMTWWVLPALKRQAILRARGPNFGEKIGTRLGETTLVRLNFALGLVVLALTALARTG